MRLLDSESSFLLLIDIQPRLLRTMPEASAAVLLKQTVLMAKAAALIGVPLLASRQYPKGLGELADEVLTALPANADIIDKTCFSCWSASSIAQRIRTARRRQIVLAGIEAHVCVLQTAFDLVNEGFEVHVAQDAVASRNPQHQSNALIRMRAAGITVSNSESIVFEWLRDAAHEHFKAVSALLK